MKTAYIFSIVILFTAMMAGTKADQAMTKASDTLKYFPGETFSSDMSNGKILSIIDRTDFDLTAQDKIARLKELTKTQYNVTQNDATEEPFNNDYWDNTQQGIYVDVVSGEPLFSSTDKYKSGTGWPSFSGPLERDNIIEVIDSRLFMVRIEVRSSHGDSHLGHVFDDGPKPAGLRYCINSASLRFIPVANLQKEGYGDYLKLFN